MPKRPTLFNIGKDVMEWLKDFQIYLCPLSEFSVLFGLFNVNHFKLINQVILIDISKRFTLAEQKINKTDP